MSDAAKFEPALAAAAAVLGNHASFPEYVRLLLGRGSATENKALMGMFARREIVSPFVAFPDATIDNVALENSINRVLFTESKISSVFSK